ncbi:peptidylprolyl isomerase (plasmid) [Paraburkholderia sp. PREW-6R]|uniref:peptidylprolyl isomerase n=1 Tax=Paraburkholderia sp. PREW-6R TaxID=3141544 RepID=UPI0031F4F617
MLTQKETLRAACGAVCIATTLAISAISAMAADVPQSATAMPSGVIALVNGASISQAQLDDAVRAASELTHETDTPQLRLAIKQQLIARELFRQNAEKAGYGIKPEVEREIEAAKINAETQLYLKDNVKPETVTDLQIRARYDELVAGLGKNEYKPRIIVVPDLAASTAAFNRLKAGQAFDDVARQLSKSANAQSGGEMPWVSFKTPAEEGKTQGLPLAVAQAIQKLSAGGMTSQPVALGKDGGAPYAIVKVDAVRPTQIPSFEEARESIREELEGVALEKAATQFTAELMKTATIQQ